ncbi:MAG: regulatory protein RecX [Candidatus Absconditabacterales bacterium]
MRPCLDYAMDYIYRFPKTEKELKVQLTKKGYYEDDIEETMEELKRRGYLSDEMFAKLYIQSELVNKGKPSIVVVQKLLFKGVDKTLVKDLMQQYEEESQEGINERIRKEIDKLKKQGLEGVDIIHKLLRRGYKLDEIKKTLQK